MARISVLASLLLSWTVAQIAGSLFFYCHLSHPIDGRPRGLEQLLASLVEVQGLGMEVSARESAKQQQFVLTFHITFII